MLDEQAVELWRLQDRDVAAVMRAMEDARRELRERLATLERLDRGDSFTAQHVRAALAQAEAAVASLRGRLDGELSQQARHLGELASRHLIATIEAHEGDLRDAGSRVDLGILARLSREQGLALHRYSIDRYGAQLVEAIQREISRSFAMGLSIPAMTQRVAGTDSVFTRQRYSAELIVRMEGSRAYNEIHQAALEEAASILDEPGRRDPLMRQIDEYTDDRNHPFSRVADGTVAKLNEAFRVPAADVAAMASRMKLRVTGMVWQQQGAYWVGGNLPAHFGERGRIVPWRASWDETRPAKKAPRSSGSETDTRDA